MTRSSKVNLIRADSSGSDAIVSVVRGFTVANLVAAAVQATTGLALVVGLLAELGMEQTGVLVQAVALVTIGATVARAGADVGTIRLISHADLGNAVISDFIRLALIPVAISSCLLASGVAVLAPTLEQFLEPTVGSPDVVHVLRIMALGVPAAACTALLVAAAQAKGATVLAAACDRVARPSSQLLLCVGAASAGAPLEVVSALWVSSIAVTTVPLVGWLLREIRADREVGWPAMMTLGDFWRFSMWRGVSSTCQSVMDWLDTVLVGVLIGPGAAAVYVAATRCLLPGLLAHYSLVSAVQPMLGSLLAAGRIARAQHLCRVTSGWLVTLTWPFYILMAGFAPDVLRTLDPTLLSGTAAVQLLAFGFLIVAAAGPVDACLLMAGRSGASLLAILCGTAISVVLDLVWIPEYGLTGAAAAWGVGIVVAKALATAALRAALGTSRAGLERRRAMVLATALTVPAALLGISGTAHGSVSLVCAAVGLAGTGAMAWRWRSQLCLTRSSAGTHPAELAIPPIAAV
jgi:O-antigen/teichoic acid export membrane protein